MDARNGDGGIWIRCRSGSFVHVPASCLLDKVPQIRQLLSREECSSETWRFVGLAYYRLKRFDVFESFLEKAVDIATSSLIASYAPQEGDSEGSTKGDDRLFRSGVPAGGLAPKLCLAHINACTTLAGFYVYKILARTGCLIGIGRELNRKAVDVDECSRAAEDLLKKAELLLQAIVTRGCSEDGPQTLPLRDHLSRLENPASLRTLTHPASSGMHRSSTTPAQSSDYCKEESQLLDTGDLHSTSRDGAELPSTFDDPKQRLVVSRGVASPLLWYGYLYLALYAGSEDRAKRSTLLTRAFTTFRLGLTSHPESLLAKLGLAASHYAAGQFSDALRYYASVLYMCPKGPPELRLALALCHINLGEYERALQAFHRVLELCPGHLEALCGLSALHLLQGIPRCLKGSSACPKAAPIRAVSEEAARYLIAAYAANPHHSWALLGLTNIAFLGEQYEVFTSLMDHAKNVVQGRYPLAELAYQQGRLHHRNRHIDAAEERYKECLRRNPRHLGSRYALAQVSLLQRNLEEAESQLQILLRLCPNYPSVLKLLGFSCLVRCDTIMTVTDFPRRCEAAVHIGVKSFADDQQWAESCSQRSFGNGATDAEMYLTCADECVNELLRVSPSDKEALLMLIRLAETRYQQGRHWVLKAKALPAYETVLDIQWTSDDRNLMDSVVIDDQRLPLINNLAILYAIDGLHNKAVTLLDRCLQHTNSRMESIQDSALRKQVEAYKKVTEFNRALVLETEGNYREASKIYKTLAETRCSECWSAWQRRCWLSLSRSDLCQTKYQCDQALKSNIPRRVVAFILAEVYKREKRLEKAIKEIRHVVAEAAMASDSYAQTVLATLYHHLGRRYAYEARRFRDAKACEQFSSAGMCYTEALRLDPSNWYAANGLAVLMAEQSISAPALEAFSVLLDVSTARAASLQDRATDSLADVDSVKEEVPDTTSVAFLKPPASMEALCHQNLGLLYLSLAMTERPEILPGRAIQHLDGMKVAKALKHTASALALNSCSAFSVSLQLARLLHDACRFRESQRCLEVALQRWPFKLTLRHNLACVLEKAVMSEMQIDDYISDPEKVKAWISECRIAGAIYDSSARLLRAFSPLKGSHLAGLRADLLAHSYTTTRHGSLEGVSKTRKPGDPHNIPEMCKTWQSGTGIPIPPDDIHFLPSVTVLNTLCTQVNVTLRRGLEEMLPRVIREGERRRSELQSLDSKRGEQNQSECHVQGTHSNPLVSSSGYPRENLQEIVTSSIVSCTSPHRPLSASMQKDNSTRAAAAQDGLPLKREWAVESLRDESNPQDKKRFRMNNDLAKSADQNDRTFG